MSDFHPLSYNQELMLAFAAESGFDASRWNQQVIFDLRDYDDTDVREAIRKLCRRHGILRTRLGLRGGRHCQVVDGLPTSLPHRTAEGEHTSPRATAGTELATPFDLYDGPLFRTAALPRTDGGAWLILTVNHLISDRQSEVMLAEEFARYYERSALREDQQSFPEAHRMPEQYTEFARWQRSQVAWYLRDPSSAPQWLRYEKEIQAAGRDTGVGSTQPPAHRPEEPERHTGRRTVILRFTTADMERLTGYCRAQKATLNVVFLAALKTAMAALPHLPTGLLLGEKTTRPLGFTDTLGPFPDLWPLIQPQTLPGDYAAMLSSVRKDVLTALDVTLPFHILVRRTPWLLKQLRQGHRSNWVLYQYFNDTAARTARFTRIAGIDFPDEYGRERDIYGIHIHMRMHKKVLAGTVSYRADRFRQSDVMELVDMIRHVLHEATGHPLALPVPEQRDIKAASGG